MELPLTPITNIITDFWKCTPQTNHLLDTLSPSGDAQTTRHHYTYIYLVEIFKLSILTLGQFSIYLPTNKTHNFYRIQSNQAFLLINYCWFEAKSFNCFHHKYINALALITSSPFQQYFTLLTIHNTKCWCLEVPSISSLVILSFLISCIRETAQYLN